MNRYAFTALSVFMSAALSCSINNDYDLSSGIDTDVTVGGELSLPIGNAREMTLFSDYDNDGKTLQLKKYSNGDYYFHYSLEKSTWPFKIPSFSVKKANNTFDQSTRQITLPDGDFGTSECIPFCVESDFKVNETGVPQEILEIKEASGKAEFNTKFYFDNIPLILYAVTIVKGFSITFPEWCCISAYDTDLFTKGEGNSFLIKEDIKLGNMTCLNFAFTVDKMDFTKFPEGQGLVEPGKIVIDSKITVKGNMYVSSSDVKEGLRQTELGFTVANTYSDFTVNTITAKIDPGASVSIRPIEFSGLSDFSFLNTEESVFDICGGAACFTIYSGIPLDATFNADLCTYDAGGQKISSMSIPGESSRMRLNSNAVSKFCLTEDVSCVPSGYTPVIIPGLSDIVKTWPDKVKTENIRLAAVNDDFITLDVGESRSQDVTVEGSLDIPLKFGNNLKLSATYDDKDFSFDFGSNVSFRDAQIQMSVANTLPLQLDLDFILRDTDTKEEIPQVKVTLPAGEISKPSTTSVTIPIKAKADISKLELKTADITISCPEGYDGVCLNEKQGITFADIKLYVHDGITIK